MFAGLCIVVGKGHLKAKQNITIKGALGFEAFIFDPPSLNRFYKISPFFCCVFRPANACLHMCSHGWKQWKTLENDQKNTLKQYFLSCVQEAYVQKWLNLLEIATFLIIFKHFSLFLTMWMLAQVWVRWSKYTTFFVKSKVCLFYLTHKPQFWLTLALNWCLNSKE